MAISFPSSPSTDDVYLYNGVKYVYDGTKWISGGQSFIDTNYILASEGIDRLVDVDTSTVAPTDGQALVYDSTAGKWEPGVGDVEDGDKGDIVVSSSGATFTVEAFSQDIDNTATGYIAMPVGTTAQRPGTPANGQQRYNSDLGAMEVYVQGQWQPIANTSIDYGLITSSSTTTFDYGALS